MMALYPSESSFCLIAVACLAVRKWAHLDVQQLVLRLVPHHYAIASLAQSGNQYIGIFLAGYRGHLHHRSAWNR